VSSTISECACGCDGKNGAAISPAPDGREKRDSPPPRNNTNGNHHQVELSSQHTPIGDRSTFSVASSTNRFEMRPSSNHKSNRRNDILRASHMPSGLSVESDPEMETSSVSAVAKTIAD
jgi:hypothetical protein